MDSSAGQRLPLWLFNDQVKDTAWRVVPYRVAHPLQLPPGVRSHVVALQQTGDPEPLVRGAVRRGLFLILPQLRALRPVYNYDLPARGSGKRGNYIKKDFAEAFVGKLFEDAVPSCSPEALHEMVQKILGRSAATLGRGSKHSESILSAFRALDREDQPNYEKLVSVACDEERLKEQRAARADLAAEHSKVQHRTPEKLAPLLPAGKGFLARLTRHPQLKRYQGFFADAESGCPGSTDELGLVVTELTLNLKPKH